MSEQEWFADEAFWRELYPFMFPEERFALAAEQMPQVLALTNPPGRAVLDLACGPGRFAVPLAQHGYQVTGVDRTPFLLDQARARAMAAGVAIEFVQQDMRDFVRPEAFDLALSMFTSFGYFADRDEDVRVLANLYASLRPGGVCLIDVMGKERLARIFMPTMSESRPEGTLVQRHEVIDGWSRMKNEWILIQEQQVRRFRFEHSIYSGQELRERLEWVGFQDVQLFGNFEGEEYGLEAQRLVVTGRKV